MNKIPMKMNKIPMEIYRIPMNMDGIPMNARIAVESIRWEVWEAFCRRGASISQCPPQKVQTKAVLLPGTLVNLKGRFILGKWLLDPKDSCYQLLCALAGYPPHLWHEFVVPCLCKSLGGVGDSTWALPSKCAACSLRGFGVYPITPPSFVLIHVQQGHILPLPAPLSLSPALC